MGKPATQVEFENVEDGTLFYYVNHNNGKVETATAKRLRDETILMSGSIRTPFIEGVFCFTKEDAAHTVMANIELGMKTFTDNLSAALTKAQEQLKELSILYEAHQNIKKYLEE